VNILHENPENTSELDSLVSGRRSKRQRIHFKTKWFTTSSQYANGKYPLDCRGFANVYPDNQNLAFPFNFDTEFVTDSGKVESPLLSEPETSVGAVQSRMPVTYQIKSTTDYRPGGGTIFASHDLYRQALQDGREGEIRHPIILDKGVGEVVPLEYLKQHETSVSYRRDLFAHQEKCLPLLLLVTYAFFAVADVPLLATGQYQEDILTRFTGDRSQGIRKNFEMKRRLSVKGWGGYAPMPWVVSLNGNEYRVALAVVDTVATHGNASYAGFCKTSGVALEIKDFMRVNGWIKKMDKAYFQVPEEFDAYSLGDLRTSEALEKNAQLSRNLYTELGIGDYFQPPKLSIGGTVANLIESVLAKQFNLSPEEISAKKDRYEFLNKVVRTASADHLSHQVHTPEKLLSKVEGGLCRLRVPTTTTLTGNLSDIDIVGAYAGRMASLVFPCGEPVIQHWNGKGQSLNVWLKNNRKQLVAGAWVARIKTIRPLDYEQDLILCWWGYLNKDPEPKPDGEGWQVAINLDTGNTKILTSEIVDGTLNDTLLEIIEKVWSKKQREDFFSKVVVTVSAHYPKTERIEPGEWFEIVEREKPLKRDKYKWCGLPFGEMLVDKIRTTRTKYDKGSPENLYAKLIGNTVYGDSVSRYFPSSNMVFGANITAGVRAVMYLTEKGLNLAGSITDGQVFDLKKVLYRYPGRHYRTEHWCRLYTMTGRELCDTKASKVAPLHPEPEKLSDKQVRQFALEHLQTQFPELSCLKNTDFKVEVRATRATFHGSANYLLRHNDGGYTLKMRSYESKKEHFAVALNDVDQLENCPTYSEKPPALVFMESLERNPERVQLPPAFYKWKILKPGDFSNRKKFWMNTNLIPGDSYPAPGIIRPFSLSQFLFRTAKQYETWERGINRWKNKYGYSLELFFLNDDGTLNFKAMIATVDRMIRGGVPDPIKALDRNNHFTRNMQRNPARYRVAVNNWRSLDQLKHAFNTLMELPADTIQEVSEDEMFMYGSK
jgi:hypothetical protein